MIPKIIHFVWLSDEAYPENIRRCLATFESELKGYELRKWTMEDARTINSEYLLQAIKERKWAFATDYIRMYAVYNFGGIYLDSDVYIYRNFNPLLSEGAFIGRENSLHIHDGKTEQLLSAHCFGAEPGNEFIGKCLSYYDKHSFCIADDATLPQSLRLNLTTSPQVMAEIAVHDYGLETSALHNEIRDLNVIKVYPSEYFDPQKQTGNSYIAHLAAGSWRKEKRYEPDYSFRYKIEWRIVSVLSGILRKMGYVTVKLR